MNGTWVSWEDKQTADEPTDGWSDLIMLLSFLSILTRSRTSC